ncbi:hypothetical protein C0993_010071 [Termitomyces sp. T159_Od127]|nr:hypothetical protein C0993_010071 [Termitomyces sp. T159_Od127]
MPGTMNPMGSPSSLPGEPDEPGEGVEQPIGAIVGGVLGGVFSLAVIVAAILYCRRKRRSSSDLLWTTRENNASPSPSLEEDWDSKAAMHEDISGTTSAPPNYDYHDAIGRQDTNMTENKNWTSGKTKEEEFESEQERRREEIYERMRRVLDNDSNTLDSNTLHK